MMSAYFDLFTSNADLQAANDITNKAQAAWKECIDEREELFKEITGKGIHIPQIEWVAENNDDLPDVPADLGKGEQKMATILAKISAKSIGADFTNVKGALAEAS